MTNCPHCDAPLKPAATFCLACDRPVVEETSRLSVGEPVQVSVGRPVVAVASIAGVVVLLAAAVWGGLAYIQHVHHHSTSLVVDDVKRATTLLIGAEGGQTHDCRRAARVLAGPVKDSVQQCDALVGEDAGAHVTGISVSGLDLQGEKGSARVQATVADAKGTHTVDRVVDLQRTQRNWRVSWNGRPEA